MQDRTMAEVFFCTRDKEKEEKIMVSPDFFIAFLLTACVN
jgi:hypothetical protein